MPVRGVVLKQLAFSLLESDQGPMSLIILLGLSVLVPSGG